MGAAKVDVKAIFLEALDRPGPEELSRFLEQACAADASARQRVEELLRAHRDAGAFLGGAGKSDAGVGPLAESPGTVIGSYKLLEQIGEGGFGIVFMAEQQQPVRRLVALKILKPGMDTRQVIARFEAERQALALMEHPNIARVFDGGETAGGRPYFVMELVRGVPITDFCDQNRLRPRDRLTLFLDVCHAVQHAHLKGIIHRDLKPSNVLVTLHDGTAVVKVIDFGIAKATGQQLTEKTLFTNYAQMIGTPLYMSPEQAEMSGLDVDTRTDIYSLGVLLYELLTGTPPFDRERLRSVAYDEMRRILREEEPPRPSARLSTLGQAMATVSANRQSDLRHLQQLFRGELDWIVMKALDKDRNRRYETASALAGDVQHFLKDEPVLACPPSRWYRFRKLVRRNKPAFLALAALALGLLLVMITLVASNLWIREEQTRTRDEKDRAERSEQLAQQRAEQIRDGLERLKSANTLLDRGRFAISELRWDEAGVSLARAVQIRPDHASAWVELGDLYSRLGLWELAAEAFAKELELREPDSTSRWFLHALTLFYLGDRAGHGRVARRVRDDFREAVNPTFVAEMLRTVLLNPDSEEGQEELARAAEGLVVTAGHWHFLYLAGIAHYRAGHHEQAVRRLQESQKADPASPSGRALSNPVLAMAHHRLNQAAAARQTLEVARRALDRLSEEMYRKTDNRHWVHHLGAVGYWPVAWWDWMESQIYYREAKRLIDGVPPPDDGRIHVLRARAFAGLRRHSRAEAEYTAALKLLPDDPQIRMEAHRNRGYSHISFRLWKSCAAEFARAWELAPQEDYLGAFTAVASLAARDVDGYRKACAALVQRFETTSDSIIARNVLMPCVLREDSLPDMARLLPLARLCAPDGFAYVETGAGFYRAGKYEEAVRHLEKSGKGYRPQPLACCFLAMARHRLGQTGAAREALAQAVRLAAPPQASWSNWHAPLEYAPVLEEAKRLLHQGN
jgi:serine/threonine protein kinase/Flp pilus assembly protein TadD